MGLHNDQLEEDLGVTVRLLLVSRIKSLPMELCHKKLQK